MSTHTIIPFDNHVHRGQVITLWVDVFAYESPHNDPTLSLDKKLAVDDGMLFVAVSGKTVVGTVMAGYDGHRGWIYSLAVSANHRGQGIGKDLLMHAEKHLEAMGCMKVNLQIHAENPGVQEFYIALGYETEPTISMGKRIPANIPGLQSSAAHSKC